MITKHDSALDIFIEGWGRMGTYWGISKVMAEIYALLYLSPTPLTLEDMSEKLKTSRSNISVNVRALIVLGVVKKVVIRGERKDYYTAEENMGKVAKLLAGAKKKKELDPAMEIVERALAAIRSDQSPPSEVTPMVAERLAELRSHIAFVNTIFETFVENEAPDTAGELHDVVRGRASNP